MYFIWQNSCSTEACLGCVLNVLYPWCLRGACVCSVLVCWDVVSSSWVQHVARECVLMP
jgi:hypothetical protein